MTQLNLRDRDLDLALQRFFPTIGHFPDHPGEASIFEAVSTMSRVFFKGEPAPFNLLQTGWQRIFGCEEALAWLAINAGVPEAERRALMSFLHMWSEHGFLAYEGRFRLVFGKIASADLADFISHDRKTLGWTHVDGPNRYIGIRLHDDDYQDFVVVEYAADREFKQLPGTTIEDVEPLYLPRLSPEEVDAIEAKVAADGPLPYSPRRIEELSKLTGLGRAEAGLAWIGMPALHSWEKNFLPKDLRAQMGLKVQEAANARDELAERNFDIDDLMRFYCRAFPRDLSAAWASTNDLPHDHVVHGVARAWNAVFGQQITLPDDLVIELQETLYLSNPARETLAVLADPEASSALTAPVESEIHTHAAFSSLKTRAVDRNSYPMVFDQSVLRDVVALTSFMYLMRPVGDELRANLPALYKGVERQLKNPELLFPVYRLLLQTEEDRDEQTRHWLSEVGGHVLQRGAHTIADNGTVVAVFGRTSGSFYYRPARLMAGAEDPVLDRLRDLSFAEQTIRHLETLLSDGFRALVERVRSTHVPAGQFEANPVHCAPEVVDAAARRFDISENATALFLQTLALHNPTTINVQRWNGWTAACYDKATQELTTRDLLTQARRPRAGRRHFHPGAWDDGRQSPHLPIETWKLPLYGLKAGVTPPLGNILVTEPVERLFARAWERWRVTLNATN